MRTKFGEPVTCKIYYPVKLEKENYKMHYQNRTRHRICFKKQHPKKQNPHHILPKNEMNFPSKPQKLDSSSILNNNTQNAQTKCQIK